MFKTNCAQCGKRPRNPLFPGSAYCGKTCRDIAAGHRAAGAVAAVAAGGVQAPRQVAPAAVASAASAPPLPVLARVVSDEVKQSDCDKALRNIFDNNIPGGIDALDDTIAGFMEAQCGIRNLPFYAKGGYMYRTFQRFANAILSPTSGKYLMHSSGPRSGDWDFAFSVDYTYGNAQKLKRLMEDLVIHLQQRYPAVFGGAIPANFACEVEGYFNNRDFGTLFQLKVRFLDARNQPCQDYIVDFVLSNQQPDPTQIIRYGTGPGHYLPSITDIVDNFIDAYQNRADKYKKRPNPDILRKCKQDSIRIVLFFKTLIELELKRRFGDLAHESINLTYIGQKYKEFIDIANNNPICKYKNFDKDVSHKKNCRGGMTCPLIANENHLAIFSHTATTTAQTHPTPYKPPTAHNTKAQTHPTPYKHPTAHNTTAQTHPTPYKHHTPHKHTPKPTNYFMYAFFILLSLVCVYFALPRRWYGVRPLHKKGKKSKKAKKGKKAKKAKKVKDMEDEDTEDEDAEDTEDEYAEDKEDEYAEDEEEDTERLESLIIYIKSLLDKGGISLSKADVIKNIRDTDLPQEMKEELESYMNYSYEELKDVILQNDLLTFILSLNPYDIIEYILKHSLGIVNSVIKSIYKTTTDLLDYIRGDSESEQDYLFSFWGKSRHSTRRHSTRRHSTRRK